MALRSELFENSDSWASPLSRHSISPFVHSLRPLLSACQKSMTLSGFLIASFEQPCWYRHTSRPIPASKLNESRGLFGAVEPFPSQGSLGTKELAVQCKSGNVIDLSYHRILHKGVSAPTTLGSAGVGRGIATTTTRSAYPRRPVCRSETKGEHGLESGNMDSREVLSLSCLFFP